MADPAVGFLLNKLDSLLQQEVRLLKGVHQEVEEIKEELESMRSFLKDADARKEREEGVKTWVKQVRNVSYRVEDIIDDFMLRVASQRRPGSVSGFASSLRRFFHSVKYLHARHSIGKEIEIIKRRIDRISRRKEMYALQRIDDAACPDHNLSIDYAPNLELNESNVVGMESTKSRLIELLMEETGEALQLVALHGKAGLGKSTLANIVFDSPTIKTHFDRCTWASISQFRSIEELLKTMLKGLFDAWDEMFLKQIEKMNLPPLKSMLRKHLQGKRYLIVLDGMTNSNLWEHMKSSLPRNRNGCKILVTTRSKDVADLLLREPNMTNYSLQIPRLDEESSMVLFCRMAFHENRSDCPPLELQDVCRRMVNRCQGWPLALVALGRAMTKKEMTREAWERVEQTMSANPSLDTVRSIFSLVYCELPQHLRSCFLYCSIFPEDYAFRRNRLIRMWVAEGFVEYRRGLKPEEVAEEYLKELIHWGVLEVVESNDNGRVKTFRINNLLQSVVLSTSEDEDFGTVLNEHCTEVHATARRLSIHNFADEIIVTTCTSVNLLIRSLLLFKMDSLEPITLSKMLVNCKFLRILDLQGAPITQMPNCVVDLFHLRYLNLRRTRIKHLPFTFFQKVVNLQTLDVRETEIKTMPRTSKLENMCHLLMCPFVQFFPLSIDGIPGIKIPGKIQRLNKLQCLTGVRANRHIVGQLGKLIYLKKLEIFRMKREYGRSLCDSIGNMRQLVRLSVFSMSADEPLELDASIDPPPHIKSLQLAGQLATLPEWLVKLKNLRYLGLFASALDTQHPFANVQSLPSLTSLMLYQAYKGRELVFDALSFPKLKELRLMKMQTLEKMKIEESAMPCLERLEMEGCVGMQDVPHNIEKLPSLKELDLWNAPTALIDNIKQEVERGILRPNSKLSITHQYQDNHNIWSTETIS